MSKYRNNWMPVAGIGAIAVAFAMIVAGCGGSGSKEKNQASTRTTKKTQTTRTVTPPPAPAPTVDVAKAPEAVEKTAVVVPEPPKEVTYEEAESAYFAKNYDEAADLFARYTERKSGNPWGFYMLGLSSWKAGDHERAEAAFDEALALDPKHVKSMVNRSRVLLETDRPDYALVQIHDAMQIDPESGTLFRLEGRAYYGLGKTDEAIDSYRRAIEIDDQDAWAMNNLALILIDQERYAEALPPLARAVELREDVAVFRNNLGMALECTGHFRDAEAQYEAALDIDGGHEKASANLNRIAGVVEEPGVTPVDLAVLAQQFVDEIDVQKLSAIDSTPETVEALPESPAVPTVAVSDSTLSLQNR